MCRWLFSCSGCFFLIWQQLRGVFSACFSARREVLRLDALKDSWSDHIVRCWADFPEPLAQRWKGPDRPVRAHVFLQLGFGIQSFQTDLYCHSFLR